MDQPADFLPRVLHTLAHSASARAQERRNAPRFGLHGLAEMVPIDQNHFPRRHSVRVRDVSATGIGVIASEKFDEGTQFELHFDGGAHSDRPLRVICLAQHCQRVSDNSHRIGARVIGHADERFSAAA